MKTRLFLNFSTKHALTHRPPFSDCFQWRSAFWTFPYPPFPSALQGDLQLSSTAPPFKREKQRQLRSIFQYDLRLVQQLWLFFEWKGSRRKYIDTRSAFTHFYHMLTKYGVSFLTWKERLREPSYVNVIRYWIVQLTEYLQFRCKFAQ